MGDDEAGLEFEMVTVAEAAELLGVSASTLRNWDRAGKLKAKRHPMNQYRLYSKTNLLAVRESIAGYSANEPENSVGEDDK